MIIRQKRSEGSLPLHIGKPPNQRRPKVKREKPEQQFYRLSARETLDLRPRAIPQQNKRKGEKPTTKRKSSTLRVGKKGRGELAHHQRLGLEKSRSKTRIAEEKRLTAIRVRAYMSRWWVWDANQILLFGQVTQSTNAIPDESDLGLAERGGHKRSSDYSQKSKKQKENPNLKGT